MRPEFDRQMDSLLREHARRGDSAGGAGPLGGGPAGARSPTPAAAHLDADELSAFAENALPERARARHTAHLAECGQCRKLAAQLVMSSGVADEIERREKSLVTAAKAAAASASPSAASHARGWRAGFASLFGSGAWRYAMPLAALLVVSAAVLLVFSGNRRAGLGDVAARKETTKTSQGGELNHAPGPQPQAGAAISQNQDAGDAQLTAEERAKSEARPAEAQTQSFPTTLSDPVAPAGGGVGSGPPPAPTEAEKSLTVEAAPPPATFAGSPTPAPVAPARLPEREVAAAASAQPAPAVVKLDDAKAAEAKEKDRYEDRNAMRARKQSGHGPSRNMDSQLAINRQADETQEAARARNSEGKSEDDASRNKPKSSPQRSAGRAAAAPAARDGGQRREDRSGMTLDGEESGGEVRGAGGRRFRRRDGVWVDTAYKPSQATVRIRRGSEQYRSLVGDEPGIGRIADALGGELVVVWKGRAYRIK